MKPFKTYIKGEKIRENSPGRSQRNGWIYGAEYGTGKDFSEQMEEVLEVLTPKLAYLCARLLKFCLKQKSLIKSLFLNADSGFDSENLRQNLEMEEIIGNIKTNPRNGKTTENNPSFDEKLYENRFKIEQANAWIDGFKALLIRFETLDITWKNLHFFVFSLILIKKLKV